MTHADIDLIVEGVIPSLKSYVRQSLDGLKQQIDSLTMKEGPAGKDGRDGLDGKDGQDGAAGEKGANGLNGERGADGLRGESGPIGEKGLTGERGERGADGRDGKDGKDGRDGKDGLSGQVGDKGIDGVDGKDGIDGMGFDDLALEHDGERTVTFTWTRGELVKSYPVTFPVTIYRGVYDAAKGYERGDQVTWGGNTWTAKINTTDQPGFTTGKSGSWQLSCKAGRDGKPGKDGGT